MYKRQVIVVGAGVAGASLAYTLGNEGRRVLLLERDLRRVLHTGSHTTALAW